MKKNRKVRFHGCGKDKKVAMITLPKRWIDLMGITEEDPGITFTYNESRKKIVIEKIIPEEK